MVPQFMIHFVGLPLNAPDIVRRELNNITRGAWHLVGIKWHRDFRPKHFTHAGAREYGYQPRQGSYTRQKLHKHGHTRPLEYSGQSRRRTSIRDVRATSQKVRIVMNAPALNLRPGLHGRINPRDEMTRISAPEKTEIIRLLERLIIMGIEQNRTRRTVTVAA